MKIPTYNECLEIAEKNECFYRKEIFYKDYSIIIFNYRLAKYTDFVKPIKDSNLDGFEMRGITFVFDKNGSHKRYLMMNKFFNVNQTPQWMLEDLKDKEITKIEDKADGSLIRFIKMPNGDILAKTQNDIFNEQSQIALDLYEKDESLRELVDFSFKNNQAFLFEITGHNNKIVLDYFEDKLTLLKIRDEITGKHIPLPKCKYSVENFKLSSLNSLLKRVDTEENIEGWVITFKDGQMAKIKTRWYFERHRIIFNDSDKANIIIASTLDGRIDDILSELKRVNANEKVKYIEIIANNVSIYFNKVCNELYNILDNYSGSKIDFVREWKDHKYSNILFSSFNEIQNLENRLKNYFLEKTNKLKKAQEWLKLIEVK